MVFIKKHYLEIFAVISIIFIYFLIRIPTISALPIFTDEAIYIRWSQIAKNDASWRFISLTDGKQPLFIWITVIFMEFIKDPLIAGRFVSITAGISTLIGLFLLAREIFKSTYTGLLTAFLYAIYPFSIVYDRMALYDSLVGTFTIWGLYVVLLLVRTLRLDVALILGGLSGAAVLNKTNGFFTLALLPFSLLLFDWKAKLRLKRFSQWAILCILVAILTFAIYSILRLSPFYYIIAQKNAIFVYPFTEWIKHPFTYFFNNLFVGQQDWLVRYVGIPYLLLTFYAIVVSKKYLKESILLFVWFLAPYVYLALFGRTLYPRYIFPMTLTLLPLIGYALYSIQQRIKNSYLFIGLFLIAISYSLWSNFLIITDFAYSPIPESDKSQYYSDWPSGLGVKESIRFLKTHENGKVALFTQGTFGLMPDAYLVYLNNDPQFTIEGIWPIESNIPAVLTESAKKIPTYIVFYQPCSECPFKGKAPPSWQLETAFEMKKPVADAWLTLYKVKGE